MIVCEATQSSEEQLQVAAFECLVRIMQLYYDNMLLYMEKALFAVSCTTWSTPRFGENFSMAAKFFNDQIAAYCRRNEQWRIWCCAASHWILVHCLWRGNRATTSRRRGRFEVCRACYLRMAQLNLISFIRLPNWTSNLSESVTTLPALPCLKFSLSCSFS